MPAGAGSGVFSEKIIGAGVCVEPAAQGLGAWNDSPGWRGRPFAGCRSGIKHEERLRSRLAPRWLGPLFDQDPRVRIERGRLLSDPLPVKIGS